MGTVGQLSTELLQAIREELERDWPFGGWMADEGVRVLQAVEGVDRSIQSGSTISQATLRVIIESEAASWFEIHSKAYEAAQNLCSALGGDA